MKNFKTRNGYLTIISVIILSFFGILAIFLSNSDYAKQGIIIITESNQASLNTEPKTEANEAQITWDELDAIFSNSEKIIKDMSKEEADEYLRNEINNYLEMKSEISFIQDDEYK